ncbi:unnamed protein product, partial [Dicrocoelium dendriticum]
MLQKSCSILENINCQLDLLLTRASKNASVESKTVLEIFPILESYSTSVYTQIFESITRLIRDKHHESYAVYSATLTYLLEMLSRKRFTKTDNLVLLRNICDYLGLLKMQRRYKSMTILNDMDGDLKSLKNSLLKSFTDEVCQNRLTENLFLLQHAAWCAYGSAFIESFYELLPLIQTFLAKDTFLFHSKCLRFSTAFTICILKSMFYLGSSATSESLARDTLSKLAEASQLTTVEQKPSSKEVAVELVLSTIQLSTIIFKRSVFESRRRPEGSMKPRVKVDFATLLMNQYPRTQTECCLASLFPNPASQLLAIVEALSTPPAERRSLFNPALPEDENSWEINDVYTELLIAALELIYPKVTANLGALYGTGFRSGHHPPNLEVKNLKATNTIARITDETIGMLQLELVELLAGCARSNRAVPDTMSPVSVSCTTDTVLCLMEMAFAISHYEIFVTFYGLTARYLKDLLQQDEWRLKNPKATLYVTNKLKVVELMWALYLVQREERILSKGAFADQTERRQTFRSETTIAEKVDRSEDVEETAERMDHLQTTLKRVTSRKMLKLTMCLLDLLRDQENAIAPSAIGIYLDTVAAIWDYCMNRMEPLMPENTSSQQLDDRWIEKATEMLYLLRLVQFTLLKTHPDHENGLLATSLATHVLWLLKQLETCQSPSAESTVHAGRQWEPIVLAAIRLNVTQDLGTEGWCHSQYWIAIWKETVGVLDWTLTEIGSHLGQLEQQMFNGIEEVQQAEHLELSELYIEVSWLQREVSHKIDRLKVKMWIDQHGPVSGQALRTYSEELYFHTAQTCRKNPIAKALHYCQIDGDKENVCSNKELLEKAEALLLSRESMSSRVREEGKFEHTEKLEIITDEAERPPPPQVISKTRTSVTLVTKPWTAKTGGPVAYYALYGRPVTKSKKIVQEVDDKLHGTITMTPVVRGLCILHAFDLAPDVEYTFAVSAYDAYAQPLGTHRCGLGKSTQPILTAPMQSTLVAIAHLAQTAFRRNVLSVARRAFQVLWENFVETQMFEPSTKIPEPSVIIPLKVYKLRLSGNEKVAPRIALRYFVRCLLLDATFFVNQFHPSNLTETFRENLEHQTLRIDLSQRLLVGMELAATLEEDDVLVGMAKIIDILIAPLMENNICIPVMAK